jgi:GTP-binding protein
LLELGRRPRYVARDGQPGAYRNRAGRDAEDLVLEVPAGTQVFDAERGNLLRDLVQLGDRVVVAEGGAGGLGNVHFANAVRQAPRIATPGQPGETFAAWNPAVRPSQRTACQRGGRLSGLVTA